MNLIGFVFSLLLIFSLSFFACFEKFVGAQRLRSTYLGHQRVNRKISSSYENELYKDLPGAPKKNLKSQSSNQTQTTKKPAPTPNADCSRLNLYPLIQEGREDHPLLYELTAKLLRSFYQTTLFANHPRFEYKFLEALLKVAKKNPQLPLEKFDFGSPEMQTLYYKMMKGSTESYPSLLDYIKIEPIKEELCLQHAHLHLMEVLFGLKAGKALYEEIHKKEAPPITNFLIEQICNEAHTPIYDPEIFSLLRLNKPKHKLGPKRTIVEEDAETAVTLRKNLYTETI